MALLLACILSAVRLAAEQPRIVVVDFAVDRSVADRTITGSAVRALMEQALISAGGQAYTFVTRTDIAKAIEELKFSVTDLVDPAKVQKFGRFLSANFLVTGEVVQLGKPITITAKYFNVETGAIVRSEKVVAANLDAFNNLFDDLARKLLQIVSQTAVPDPASTTVDVLKGAATGTIPANMLCFLITEPAGAVLTIAGKRLTINDTTLRLAQGTHFFMLSVPEGGPIYGRFMVHATPEQAALSTFGTSDGVIFKQTHLDAALRGRPVSYEFRFGASPGTGVVAKYDLSLHPFN